MPDLRKLPECQQCQFNARSPYVVCAVHPNGPKENSCLDFRLDNSIQVEPNWAPDGTEFYNGDSISTTKYLSPSDRISLLESHPMFTGRCPKCSHEFLESPLVHWDCEVCGWKDDSA